MDNLAHALTGAALGRAGLDRLSGLAMPALVLSANVPDIDAVAMLAGGGGLYWRRGWTHGPIALVILPALLAVLLVAYDRWQASRAKRPASREPVQLKALLLICYIGAVSHVLLDLLNTYGVRLLMPFSERWFYGDVLFIVDPWIWLGLGVGVWLTRRRRLAGRAAIGRPAIGALVAASLYIAVMFAGGRLAERYTALEVESAGLGPPQRVLASPVIADPFRREIIVETAEGYRFGEYRLAPVPKLSLDEAVIPTNLDDPAVARAGAESRRFSDFLYWARFPYATIEHADCTATVTINDGRYSRRTDGGPFRTTVTVPNSCP